MDTFSYSIVNFYSCILKSGSYAREETNVSNNTYQSDIIAVQISVFRTIYKSIVIVYLSITLINYHYIV